MKDCEDDDDDDGEKESVVEVAESQMGENFEMDTVFIIILNNCVIYYY